MPTLEAIRQTLLPVFAQEPVYRAILFGSYAKGTATDNSDIDLVIDSHGKLIGLGFYRVLEEVASVLGREVDMLEISQIGAASPLWKEIEKDGVVIYDRQFS